MSVHYPKGLIGRCKAAGLRPVSIAIGIDFAWQGGVTADEQVELYEVMRRLMLSHPTGSLSPEKISTPEPSANGVHGHAVVAPVARTQPIHAAADAAAAKKK